MGKNQTFGRNQNFWENKVLVQKLKFFECNFQLRCKGQYTKEDGYMAYYEMCKWTISEDPNLGGSAVAKFTGTLNWNYGDYWGGFETVSSANVKLDFLIEKGMAGIMFWAMDIDDYNGQFCGQGKYPVISGIYNNLKLKWDGTKPTTTAGPNTTKPTARV